MKLLVGMGVDINEPADNDSVPSPENVLKRAASKGHLHVVEWMLDQGARIDETVNGQVRSFALLMAARKGHLDVVKLLVERGAAVNSVWAEMSPLDHAIDGGDEDTIAYLRSVGAKQAEELTA